MNFEETLQQFQALHTDDTTSAAASTRQAFYEMFRQCVFRGLHSGDLRHNPEPGRDFWTRWEQQQTKE